MEFFNYRINRDKKLQFKKPFITEINGERYYFISIRYRKREIFIKIPKLVVPFGINIYESDAGEKIYYYAVSFTDGDIDADIAQFCQYIQRTESFIQSVVKARYAEWGCTVPFEHLQFKSNLLDNGGTYLFRLKINPKVTEIYDEKGLYCNLSEAETLITPHCHIISLIELNNVWINSTEYGITWKVYQSRVYPSGRPLGGVSLLDETIAISTIKIVDTPYIVNSSGDADMLSVPVAPPPPIMLSDDPPPKSWLPTGAVALLPFLSDINQAQFALRSTAHVARVAPRSSSSQPAISLEEILKIRNRLKKN